MNILKKLLFALLVCTLLGAAWSPVAYADDHETDDSAETVEDAAEAAEDAAEEVAEAAENAVEEIGYDPIPAIVGMRDMQEVLARMGGSLDRYDGSGHLDDCDSFTQYAIITLLLGFSFELEAAFGPGEWQDVMTLASEAALEAFTANEAIFSQCGNGRDDSISTHNLAAGRAGIAAAQEKLRSAFLAATSRAGIDPEAVPSSIGPLLDTPPDPAEIEFIAEELGLTWDAEIFYEDLLITEAFLQNIGGWLDRLIAGATVGCGEYIIYVELALSPVPFLTVEDTWRPLFNEHVAIINSLLDSNKELINVCLEGGNINEFMVFKAREGVALATDRLHRIKQETERRLDIAPR